jgi:hypothetical protein
MDDIDELWRQLKESKPSSRLPDHLHPVQRDALRVLVQGRKNLFFVINTGTIRRNCQYILLESS